MSKNSVTDEVFTSSDTHNGTHTDKYSWTQNISDLDVKIPVGTQIRKGKDLIVDIKSDYIRVSLASSKDEYIIDGKLTSPINKQESYWNLAPGEAVYIWLQKVQEKWWTALIEGETPIDMKSIEPVRSMADLAEDEQMKIAELMFNQDQKRKGLPTSDEIKMQNILKKAWDAEGSPFKGTPFDPSRVQLGNSNYASDPLPLPPGADNFS